MLTLCAHLRYQKTTGLMEGDVFDVELRFNSVSITDDPLIEANVTSVVYPGAVFRLTLFSGRCIVLGCGVRWVSLLFFVLWACTMLRVAASARCASLRCTARNEAARVSRCSATENRIRSTVGAALCAWRRNQTNEREGAKSMRKNKIRMRMRMRYLHET